MQSSHPHEAFILIGGDRKCLISVMMKNKEDKDAESNVGVERREGCAFHKLDKDKMAFEQRLG